MSQDKKDIGDEVLHVATITFEVAGLILPPFAIVANDLKVITDFYEFMQDHVQKTPGFAKLPGPPLMVRNPLK